MENKNTEPIPVMKKPMLPPRRDTSESFTGSSLPQADGTRKVRPAVPRKPLSLSSQGKVGAVSPSSQHISRQDSPGNGVTADTGSTDLLSDSGGEQIEWKPLFQ
jgi:hypothetical protein